MTPRPNRLGPNAEMVSLRVSADVIEELRGIQDRDGVPVSEQVRRGIQLWLESRGVKTERKRPASRKRP